MVPITRPQQVGLARGSLVSLYHWRMLNERLKNLRLAKGLTLQQVGDAFGISKASISSWESGRSHPDHKKLVALAELLGTTVQYLIAGNFDHANVSPTTNNVPFIEWSSILDKTDAVKISSTVTPLHSSPSDKAFATRYPASQTIQWQLGSIPAGSLLIVDPEITPGPSDTVIAQIKNEITLAKFSATPENKSILVKADTSEFQQIPVANSPIIGVVLEWQLSGKLK
jgi:transcriptional regulator with XRE-family HTH domain